MQYVENCKAKAASLRGKIASLIGIIANVLLATTKIVVGSLFGLISVVADGLNNLTDCGSSVVSLISFKLSSKPPDKEHPFGHERIEYICSLSVAFLILFVAVNTVRESIEKIINPTGVVFSYWIIAVLAASILVKFSLFLYYRITARKINSTILSATAIDCLTDSISTLVTLACFIISAATGYNADGYVGIIVALFIAWSAIVILRGAFSNLIGKAPDKQMIKDIRNRILAYDGVLSVHDLCVYCYGANKFFASVHIEVAASVDVLVSHELIDEIERDFAENTSIVLTGHLDPVEVDNPEVNELKCAVQKIVGDIDTRFSIHDFRVVRGENHTNVLFDVAIPYEADLSKEEIKERIEAAVSAIDKKYRLIITVEYDGFSH